MTRGADLEYIRQVSPAWRFVTALEMEDDEVSLITEGQWRIREPIKIKLNSGFGVTPKAPDVASEVGVLLSF